MCGLFGFYSKRDAISDNRLKDLEKSIIAISHRGPDGAGTYLSYDKKMFLSHTRLSVNDLSNAGSQPYTFENFRIVFNGEIYNFKKLKEELVSKFNHQFQSQSDTEVIAVMYKYYKEKCLDFFIGMFAFAIYDENNGELFLARDHIGEKPLVYAEKTDGFYFCSEIPGILNTANENITPKLDLTFMLSSGNHRHIPDPFTLWDGIYRLPPAHYMIIKNGSIQSTKQYWKPKISQNKINKTNFRNLIIESVELTTVSDVPFTILLSGGIDSSIIAYILKCELNKNVEAFVYGNDIYDEEVLRAQKVADFLRIPLRIITRKEVSLSDFDNVIRYYGEPLPLLPLLYNISIMKEIKKYGYKVIITGNGADEIFYGYTGHINTFKKTRYLDHLPPKLKNKIFPFLKFLVNYKTNNPNDLSILKEWFYDRVKTFPEFDSYIDFTNYFGLLYENAHSITLSSDIAGSFYGLEQRSPFLNKNLIESCFNTIPSDKIQDKGGFSLKVPLKIAFGGNLPDEVFSKPKIGFGFFSKENTFGLTRESFIEGEINRWKNIYNLI